MIELLNEILINFLLVVVILVILALAACAFATLYWIQEDIGDAPGSQIESPGRR